MPAIVNNKSQGAYKATSWIKEGDGLLLSSTALRESWNKNKENLRAFLAAPTINRGDIFIKDFALSRSSILLLGYSLEMFLKAGIVKLYIGCPEDLARAELRNFGHKYGDIAKRIHFIKKGSDGGDFNILSRSVIENARYPVTPQQDKDYAEELNKINNTNSSQQTYERLEKLVRRVKSHVSKLNNDSSNATSYTVRDTEFGYFVARIGGGLPPMVTYKSDILFDSDELHQKILSHSTIAGRWEDYTIYEDMGENKERRCRSIQNKLTHPTKPPKPV